MKRLLIEIFLYISSFIPLYFLIIVKELIEIANDNLTFNVTNTIMLCLNLLLIIVGVVGTVMAYKQSGFQMVKVIDSKNVTQQEFLSYFSLFVLFALAFELEYISMAVVYVLIIIMVGIVNVRNKIFHINPFLNIMGFSSYEVTFELDGKKMVRKLFSRREIAGEGMINDVFFK